VRCCTGNVIALGGNQVAGASADAMRHAQPQMAVLFEKTLQNMRSLMRSDTPVASGLTSVTPTAAARRADSAVKSPPPLIKLTEANRLRTRSALV
jgi:hypothetical protein